MISLIKFWFDYKIYKRFKKFEIERNFRNQASFSDSQLNQIIKGIALQNHDNAASTDNSVKMGAIR